MALDLGTLNIKLKVNGADSAKKDLNEVGNSVENIEGKSSKLTGGVGKLGTALKGALAAGVVIEGAKAIASGIQACVDAYADFEQAAGGAELLYGDAYDQISQQAQDAAKNMQLSSTQYLQYANQISGALSRGLGGDMAQVASYSDSLIASAADIAAAYGYSTEETMNRIVSIANGNYQALDTLTAGAFAGTKEGLENLVAYASEGLGQALDASNFADISTALEYYNQQCGIAGQASTEAGRTISGSIATMQASWENFKSALASGDQNQVQTALDNLVTSIGNVAQNILPVIGNIIVAVGGALVDNLPTILTSLGEMLRQLGAWLLANLPTILTNIVTGLQQLVAGILAALPDLLASILILLISLIDSIITGIVSAIIGAYDNLMTSGAELFQSIYEGALVGIETLWTFLTGLPDQILSFFSGAGDWLIETGRNIVQGLINGIKSIGSAIGNTLRGFVNDGIGAVKNLLGIASPSKLFKKFGEYTVEGFTIGVDYETDNAVDQMQSTARQIAAAFNVTGNGTAKAANSGNNYYSFGNITVDVSKLKDLTNIEDFVALVRRAQGMNPIRGGVY